MKKRQLNVRISEEVLRRVKRLAQVWGISEAELVEGGIRMLWAHGKERPPWEEEGGGGSVWPGGERRGSEERREAVCVGCEACVAPSQRHK